jgi:hypothetical protein
MFRITPVHPGGMFASFEILSTRLREAVCCVGRTSAWFPGVRVACEPLHIGQVNTLRKQIGDDRYPKRTCGERARKARILHASLHHPTQVVYVHGAIREAFLLADCR